MKTKINLKIYTVPRCITKQIYKSSYLRDISTVTICRGFDNKSLINK